MRPRAERQNIRELKQGRRDAYEGAICRHYEAVYRFLAYLTLDAGLAEELTQETFASAWAGIDSYKGRASLGTWLHQIAYHKFVDARRRLQREANLTAGLKKEGLDPRQAQNPLDILAADEHHRLLYQAMEKLDAAENTVIVLHYIQGLSFRQVAKVLEVPVGTAKWQTSRALKRLKSHLSGRI